MIYFSLTVHPRASRREWTEDHANRRRHTWRNPDSAFWYSHNKRIFIKKERGIQNNSAFGQGRVRFGKDGAMTCAGIRH